MRLVRQSLAALLIGATISVVPLGAWAQTDQASRPAAHSASGAADGRADGDGLSARVRATFTVAAARAREMASAVELQIRRGYRQQPALMIGVLGALLLPVLALAGYFVYRRRPEDQSRAPLNGEVIMAASAAWIEVDGSTRVAMHEGRDFLQIGRQEDNDVCIADSSVHRYHAVIERSARQGFVIVDVSGPEGNGVVVNGERCTRAELADGDTVEVGRARLRFQIAA